MDISFGELANPWGITAWIDTQGQVRELPVHCFITSRAFLPSNRKKENHYALVCFSDQALNAQCNNTRIFPNQLRNITTKKPLGASQVTAIVNITSHADNVCNAKSYSISFTAELRSPYYIQLAQPVLLEVHEIVEIKAVSKLGNLKLWASLVKHLRSRIADQQDWVQCRLDLGDVNQSSSTDALSLLELGYPI